MAIISNTELTADDLELLQELLDEYLENFDHDEEYFKGVDDPEERKTAVQSLYSRFIGTDLTGVETTLLHPDCTCDWCELSRGEK